MASFNKVILMGNLTRDPEVRYLSSGTAVADLSLAINEDYKNKDGEKVEATVFVDVVVWARQAETCGQYLSKGSPILAEGSLQLDKWTTKEGENRSKLRVRATRVQFLGSGKGGDSEGRGSAPDAGADADTGSRASDENRSPADVPDNNNMGDDDNLPF